MTTYMQEEYEALALQERPIITDVKVNYTITNHPEELTDNELEKITSVFRSLETGLREASIYPNVRSIKINVHEFQLDQCIEGPAQSNEDAWPESFRARNGRYSK